MNFFSKAGLSGDSFRLIPWIDLKLLRNMGFFPAVRTMLALSGLPYSYSLIVFSSPFLRGLGSKELNCQLLCTSLHFSMVFSAFDFPDLFLFSSLLIILTCRCMKDTTPYLVLWIRLVLFFNILKISS